MSFTTTDAPLGEKQILNQMTKQIKKIHPIENSIAEFLKSKQFKYKKTYTFKEVDELNKQYGVTNIIESDLFDNKEFFESLYLQIIQDIAKCYYAEKGHEKILDEEMEILEDEEKNELTVKNELYILTKQEIYDLVSMAAKINLPNK